MYVLRTYGVFTLTVKVRLRKRHRKQLGNYEQLATQTIKQKIAFYFVFLQCEGP